MPTQKKTPRTPSRKNNNAPPLSSKSNSQNGFELAATPGKVGKKSQHASTPTKTPTVIPNMASLDYENIQRDEVEVLKSIFMDDYEHVEKAGAWNKSSIAFNLHLRTSSDPEISCALSVALTATYPKTVPELAIKGSEALRPNEVEILDRIIKDLPKKLVGQEMIFEIATAIQDAMEDILESRLANKDKPSLDEERAIKAVSERKRAEIEERETRLKLENEALEEQIKLEREIEKELRRQKENVRESHERRRQSLTTEEDDQGVSSGDCILFDRAIKVKRPGGNGVFTFRKVCGMVKIGQGPVMSVYAVRPTFPAYQTENIPLVLKQVDIPDRFSSYLEGTREIESLEQELDSLRTLKHANVVEVFESKVSRADSIHENDGVSHTATWRISMLVEYANKGSLSDLLDTVEVVGADTARAWTICLLEGLDYIHRHGVVHKGIHVGNILLFHMGSGYSIVPKFADVGFTKSLLEIMNQVTGATNRNKLFPARSPLWSPPEFLQYEGEVVKESRKSDIWNFGVVFLQMIFGTKVVNKFESPRKLLDSLDLSDSLSDFLESIFKPNPKKRPSAFELLPSEFLRNDDPITHPEAPSSPSSSRLSWSMPSSNTRWQGRPRHNSTAGLGPSRYMNDFTELGRLGKGGYGEVVKARNKLDQTIYAIKKINQTSGAKLTQILSEVMLLSRLNHQYVVRYFTAWLEEEDPYASRVRDLDSDDDEEDSEAVSSFSGSSDNMNSMTNGGHKAIKSRSSRGLEIEFGTSGGDLDFISHSGPAYSEIQFGYGSDTDESESKDAEDGNSTESRGASPNSNGLRRTISNEKRRDKVTLYIQMSLAERLTLRDRIQQGLGLEESWKLFRQVLEGLAHIHGLGIIHRDLKPENIFINRSGDPQIGDFGLATNDLVLSLPANNKVSSDDSGDMDLTTNVGTTLYVAPELQGTGQGKYNEKVDMYSVGIIFFEMCYPLGSGMERVHVLSSLREKEITFPPDFWTEKRTSQGQIIRSLLSHDPSERPSSSELLNSGKLPFMVEDEAIRRALQSLSDPNTPYHKQVMASLFAQGTKEYKDHTYDSERKPLSAHELLLQSLVKNRLAEVFQTHGAVETDRPSLLPRSKFYSRDVVQLLDSNGTLVQLPYDLTLPRARQLARHMSPAPKTFTFGNVFRENATGGQPTAHGEVDFDIISHNSLDLPLKEAEVIKVVDEVIDTFPSLKNVRMCHHINHSSLLDAIMEYCRIKYPQRTPAKEILSRLNNRNWQWSLIRNELVNAKLGILPTSLDDLARFDWRDEPEKAFQRLETLFEGSAVSDRVQSVISHLKAVVAYLRKFGVTRKIYINPLGTWNDKFYRGGIVFQSIYDTKERYVFAAGGRYDALIQDHRPKMRGHGEETHAVGCNIGWEQLFNSMAKYQRRLIKGQPRHGDEEANHGPWATRRCDVIVASFDSKTLRTEGLTLVQELWANGIRAELAADATSTESLVNTHRGDGVSWVVIIKQGLLGAAERNLKVKNVFRKDDYDLRQSDLISFLKSELTERDRKALPMERHLLPARLPRHSSSNEVPRTSDEAGQDVRILVSDRKGRKISRNTIIDAAQRTAGDAVNTFLRCPIAAVDLREDVLDNIKMTSFHDTEGWKRLIQGAPAPDRKYIQEVHELINEIANEEKMCVIYNFRTGGCVFYYLA